MQASSSFNNLNFINTAYNNLPIETQINNTQRKVRGYCYSLSTTEKKDNIKLAALSNQALELLDLKSEQIEYEPESLSILAGNSKTSKGKCMAHCYCGYQFGNWAGQLGDGRAHLLGDIKNKKGEIWELQLKGSGITPYSRFADGKAVIRSSVREFLCSEAMHALNIPTTRAASIMVSDTLADRDKLYTGNVIKERAAVVMRLSPSFLRFGSFQICVNEPGEPGPSVLLEKELIPKLLDYTIQYHYPQIWEKYESVNKDTDFTLKEDMYFEFYKEVTKRTAELVAKWQSVGFVHGVLNTDNMSILGLTIDYGPFEFIDHFTRNHISNHSDKGGRYSYSEQPNVCKWNLEKLAEALNPFINKDKSKGYLNKSYENIFLNEYLRLFRNKLGIIAAGEQDYEQDQELLEDMFDLMEENMSEFTNTFLVLQENTIQQMNEGEKIELNQQDQQIVNQLVELSPSKEFILSKKQPIASMNKLFQLQQIGQKNPMQLMMMGIDLQFVQNELIKAVAHEELNEIEEKDLLKVFGDNWSKWLLKYKQRVYQDYKNSNMDLQIYNEKRKQIMQQSNPRWVLKNYIAEEIIKETEKNNFSSLQESLKLFQNPFNTPEKGGVDINKICVISKTTPVWAKGLCISCSS